MKKFVNIILTILFALFAAVQFNDPDPWVWVGVYGLVAGVSAFAIMGKYNKTLLLAMMAVTLVWALYLSPGVFDWFMHHDSEEIFHSMSPDKVFIETARECFGLIIAFLAIGYHFLQARKKDLGNIIT